LIDLLPLSEVEKDHARRMLRLGKVVGPETMMRTVGNNPAEALTAVLVAHHDQKTLAWSDEPLMPLVVKDENGAPIPDAVLTSDPPPWWRAHKKNALFYNGMARGDHRGTMALATSVCVDSLAEAERVDQLFRDMHAYVLSLRAPKYPRAIDPSLADEGKSIFERNCAGCHGSYAADAGADELDTYPNLLIPLSVIGTDPAVANAGVVHAPELVDWYNGSFYGSVTPIVPDDPFPGYVAPPLDGIWATAPYFHNGSVPTIELVLDSSARPARWKRVDDDSTHFDEEALGFPWLPVEYAQEQAPLAERRYIYDTGFFSQSNAGHRFGDHLTSAERRAVIEYLKTL
jgi:mono/diheme cytochrome c family protein